MTAHRPFATAAAVLALAAGAVSAQEKTDFRVAWSIYVGWMPWGYLETSGIMDKWAAKYGIDVEIVQINDYIESINQFTAGAFDGVTATNMDTLSIPSGSGVGVGVAPPGVRVLGTGPGAGSGAATTVFFDSHPAAGRQIRRRGFPALGCSSTATTMAANLSQRSFPENPCGAASTSLAFMRRRPL